MIAEKAAKRRSSAATRIWGVILLIFALIGFITVIVLAGKGIAKLFDNTAERQQYANRIASLVTLDPMPFDDVSKIQSDVAAEACLLELSKNDNGGAAYEYDTEGRMLIPSKDIAAQGKKMFGDDFVLDLTSLDSEDSLYQYDSEADCVHVPVTGYTSLYYPRVESIKRHDGITTLHVAYMPTSMLNDLSNIQPEKYMDYVLEGDKGSEIITAVKLAE